MDKVKRLWIPWYDAWMKEPDDSRLWDHGWMLEELRVSIFAPEVPVAMKVSEKRVEEAWTKL